MRLYLTGGTGLVGSNIIRLALQRGDIEIISGQYGPEPELPYDYDLDPMDLADHEGIRKSIAKYQPDVVIHCAANLDHVFMYEQRELAWQIAVGGNRALAEASREVGARYIFISTDWVFDGRVPLVDEDSTPHPVNLYGIMKVACERELSAMSDLNYAVARLAGVYGINYSNPSLLRKDNGVGFDMGNYVLDRLSQNLVATIWTGPKVNDVANPTLASDGAEMVMRLMSYDGNGIYHCFGSEPVSRLQFAYHLADVFGIDRTLIVPIPTDPIVLDAYRHIEVPFRTVASTQKTSQALGRTAHNVLEGIHDYKKQWDAFHGS